MSFEVMGRISEIDTVAAGPALPEWARLRELYGGGRWRKMRGVATVRLADGSYFKAEIHWYEAYQTGPKEAKIKFCWKNKDGPKAERKTIRLVRPE